MMQSSQAPTTFSTTLSQVLLAETRQSTNGRMGQNAGQDIPEVNRQEEFVVYHVLFFEFDLML